MRGSAESTFERADTLRAHLGTLGEGLLRQSGGDSVLAQKRPKIRQAGAYCALLGVHFYL